MSKHAGSKITRAHSTVIDVADPLVDFAKKEKSITKISAGIITTVSRPSPKRLTITEENACILLKVRGNRYIQEIRFYSDDIPATAALLKKESLKLGFKL